MDGRRAEIVARTEQHMKELFAGEGTGHDWWHVERVRRNALLIAEGEDVDVFVVELAALLHDVADWKFHGGDDTAGPRAARAWLESIGTEPEVVDHVCAIVADVSFKGAGVENPMATLEGLVVQDADRLDAIGAIGIARTFAYGGHAGQPLHDPDLAPVLHATAEAYKTARTTSINHFHEKLLLLADRMATKTARRIARERERYMRDFLDRFAEEWAGRA